VRLFRRDLIENRQQVTATETPFVSVAYSRQLQTKHSPCNPPVNAAVIY
jgi:hypothetical protein